MFTSNIRIGKKFDLSDFVRVIPDDGHESKHVGLTIKLFYILQMLLEV